MFVTLNEVRDGNINQSKCEVMKGFVCGSVSNLKNYMFKICTHPL